MKTQSKGTLTTESFVLLDQEKRHIGLFQIWLTQHRNIAPRIQVLELCIPHGAKNCIHPDLSQSHPLVHTWPAYM